MTRKREKGKDRMSRHQAYDRNDYQLAQFLNFTGLTGARPACEYKRLVIKTGRDDAIPEN